MRGAAVIACGLLVASVGPASAASDPGDRAGGVGTLFAFFATWCGPCRSELPDIQEIYRDYGPRGLRVVLVSEDGPSSAAEVAGFLEQAGVQVPYVLDPESEMLVRHHPAATLPFTVLLDGEGRVVFAHAGYEPGDIRTLRAQVEALLARAEAAREPAPAPGDEVAASASVQGLGLWRRSRFEPRRDGDLAGAVTRIEPRLERGRSSLSFRLDTMLLGDRAPGGQPGLGPGAAAGDLRLERALLDADLGAVRLRAGDYYARVGRGMALSLRRVDPLGTDTTLRGGRLDVVSGLFRVSALAGLVNPQNFDPIEARVLPDVEDHVVGGEVAVRPVRGLDVGAYALRIGQPGTAPDGRDVTAVLGGGAVAIEVPGFRAQAEGAGGRRTGLTARPETVHGLQASAALDAGRVTLLAEAKWYRRFEFGRLDRGLAYHEPLTLERDDQRVPANADSVGGRLRADWRVAEVVTIHANGMAYRFSEDGSDPLDGGLAWHAYAGADLWLRRSRHVAVSGGFRRETRPSGALRGRLWHVEATASLPVAGSLALETAVNHVSEAESGFSGLRDFVRGLASFGVAWPDHGSVTFVYGYSTEVPTRPTHYPGGEVRVVLPHGGEVRLFGGRMAGGRVCASGTCRDLPPFEGVRLDVVLNLRDDPPSRPWQHDGAP